MTTKILNHSSQTTSIAFNGDCSQLAVGLINSNVEIYRYNGKNWELTTTLKKHINKITGLDWAPNSNKIVTCSSDRNVYVWEPCENGEWKSILVLLKVKRAITTVKWSPFESKFLIGSADRQASVCYFMEDKERKLKIWGNKAIRKPIQSTISCVAWHPNNYVIALGSTDNTCRVYGAGIKEIEDKPKDLSWGEKLPSIGNLLKSVRAPGWVTAVSFSASGAFLAFCTQASTIHIVGPGPDAVPAVYYSPALPLKTIEWATESSLIAAGHDRCIFAYTFDDANQSITCDGKTTGVKEGGLQNDRNRFNTKKSDGGAPKIETLHIAPINDLRICAGQKGQVEKFATCSDEGKIYMWDWAGTGNLAGKLEKLEI